MSNPNPKPLPVSLVPDRTEQLVARLRLRDKQAQAIALDTYAPEIARTLLHIMGRDSELADLLQETFIAAFEQIDSLDDCAALGKWIKSIAIFKARHLLRHRSRWRWIAPWTKDGPEPLGNEANPETAAALRIALRILDDLPVDERLVFQLRYLDGMPISDVAEAVNMSLATAKRRLLAAEERFRKRAARHPILDRWLARGKP